MIIFSFEIGAMHYFGVEWLRGSVFVALTGCLPNFLPLHAQEFQEANDPVAVQFLQSYYDSYQTDPGRCWKIKWVVETDSSSQCALAKDDKTWRENHELLIRLGEGMRYEVEHPLTKSISVMDWKEYITKTLEYNKKVGSYMGQLTSAPTIVIVGGSCSSPFDLGFVQTYARMPKADATFYGSVRFEIASNNDPVVTFSIKNGEKRDKFEFIFNANAQGNLKKIHQEYNFPTGFYPVDFEFENQLVNDLWFPKNLVVRTKKGLLKSSFEPVELITTPKEWLQITFPKGTTVGDSIQNIVYVVGGTSLSEEDLAKAAELAKIRSGPDASMPVFTLSNPVRFWSWMILIAIIPIVGWAVYRRVKKS